MDRTPGLKAGVTDGVGESEGCGECGTPGLKAGVTDGVGESVGVWGVGVGVAEGVGP